MCVLTGQAASRDKFHLGRRNNKQASGRKTRAVAIERFYMPRGIIVK